MIPLSDPDILRRSTPYVTIALMAASVLAFVYQLFLGDLESFRFTHRWGAIPAEVMGNTHVGPTPVLTPLGVRIIDLTSPVPDWMTMFTSMFMHAGFLHLGGNMLYLWTFGRSIEDRFGHLPFVVFYLASGVVAVFAQSLVDPDSTVPMVGASGAVAGVLGAYILLYPLSRIDTLIIMGLIFTIRIPAVALLGFWAALQYFNGVASLGPEVASGGVAYFAHLGGFAFGLLIALFLVGGTLSLRFAYAVTRGAVRLYRMAPRPVEGPRPWSSVSCPVCGSNILDFSDDAHLWHCPECGIDFS